MQEDLHQFVGELLIWVQTYQGAGPQAIAGVRFGARDGETEHEILGEISSPSDFFLQGGRPTIGFGSIEGIGGIDKQGDTDLGIGQCVLPDLF